MHSEEPYDSSLMLAIAISESIKVPLLEIKNDPCVGRKRKQSNRRSAGTYGSRDPASKRKFLFRYFAPENQRAKATLSERSDKVKRLPNAISTKA